jgi:putative membrane protein
VEFYLWIKAGHVISVIAWMAGILYLPRLFVYHSAVEIGSEISTTFKLMERRLLRFIMNPAMILSFVFGVSMLALNPVLIEESWMQYKIFVLVLMTGAHALLARWRRFFEIDKNEFSPKFYRVINEAPTLLMVIIVVLAVVRPG